MFNKNEHLKRIFKIGIINILFLLMVVRSNSALTEQIDLIRAHTRAIEFDFVSWTLHAIGVKLKQSAIDTSPYISTETRKKIVLDYLDLVKQIEAAEYRLSEIYADPTITNPDTTSSTELRDLAELYHHRNLLGPLAETIIQEQITTVLVELDIDLAGQVFPPLLYHTTEPPYGLIISPRDHIEQIADISILPDFPIDKQIALEEQIDKEHNVSSLVVGIGGIGLYPTMIMQTSSLNWLLEVVSHEWTHNFLTTRPLGINYYASPELRIINETTASIAGTEISQAVLERYYPELLPPPPQTPSDNNKLADIFEAPPVFDFRAEMHKTRITVDQLLADKKIEEAEIYMEEQRKVFVEQGYNIRKLNQAYFAFYGAYADQPGGAAGEDPVSAAVRALHAQSPSLTIFLKQISWITSFEKLQEITQPNTP